MEPNSNVIDRQRRIIMETRQDVAAMLELEARIVQRLKSYSRLGLGAEGALLDESFGGTGTDAATFQDAIGALGAFQAIDGDVWAALERFAR